MTDVSELAAAEVLKLKAALMDCIRGYTAGHGLTQQQAADLMGVQRSRIGDVSRGHMSIFSIDALVLMAARVDLHPVKIDRLAPRHRGVHDDPQGILILG